MNNNYNSRKNPAQKDGRAFALTANELNKKRGST